MERGIISKINQAIRSLECPKSTSLPSYRFAMNIKRNDNVIMLGGKDRGKKGKVLFVFPAENKVVVGGLNLIARHQRARKQGQKGQVVHKERAVNASAVQLVCSKCGKSTRVGSRTVGNPEKSPSGDHGAGNKVRVCKKCGGET